MKIPEQAPRIAGGVALCAAAGALFAWLHTPIPWMIGPFLAMAAAQMLGARLEAPPGGRQAGLLVVGTALGLYFTPPVVHEVTHYGLYFVGLGFAALCIGGLSGLFLARTSGIDRATAWFGSMPGGAAEMAMMGERYGAKTDYVAFSHSMRMLVVVTLVPSAITLAGFSATEDYRPIVVSFDALGLAELLAISLAAGTLATRIGLPTAFMMGPLITTIALTVGGHNFSSVPTWLSNAAQVLLGCALGMRFERRFLKAAPRFVMALVPAIAITIGLAAIVGVLIAFGSGAYLGTALLAAAPGGIAEMAITAKVLRIGVAFVTAAHVIRYAIVVLLCGPLFRLIVRFR